MAPGVRAELSSQSFSPITWIPQPSILPNLEPAANTDDSSSDAGPSSSSPAASQNHHQNHKSAKRKAAEERLERIVKKQHDDVVSERAQSSPLRSFVVNACDCSSSSHAAAPPLSWCSMPVTLPSLNWPAILTTLSNNNMKSASNTFDLLPDGLTIHLVESHQELAPALSSLRASMEDSIIAIDLEWRPDHRPSSNNPVALIQLASGTACVLIRCCRLGGRTLPAALSHLFSDSSLTFVSFSWDCSDESKMKSTFGIGKSCFSNFLDLQHVAKALGYASLGLASLTHRVIGVAMPKSRSVSCSNWQQPRLTPAQVQYAALDAFVTGSVFRGLRLWHASPSPCSGCKEAFGVKVRCDKVKVILSFMVFYCFGNSAKKWASNK